MIRFRVKGKRVQSTPLTDRLIVLFGGAGLLTLMDWFIRIQTDINTFIR